MRKSLWHLIIIQFKEFIRDPEGLVWGVAFPIALAWILGMAFMQQGMVSRAVGVVETPAWRQAYGSVWLDRLQAQAASGQNLRDSRNLPVHLQFLRFPGQADALLALKRGRLSLFMSADPQTRALEFYFDPKNSDAQTTYLLLRQFLPAPSGASLPMRWVPLKNPGSRYIDFLIPGLIGLGMMNSCMWGVGWALIERRMKKLLRRMVATPMRKTEFLLSYFFTRVVLVAFEVAALFLFSALTFKVRLQGSWLAFLLLFLCGNMAFIGLAILMGSRTQNSQVGNGLLNAFTIPMFILSGIFFSYDRLPAWLIPLVQALPLTILTDGLRKVFLEGAGVQQVLLPALALTATGTLAFMAGLKIFKWN